MAEVTFKVMDDKGQFVPKVFLESVYLCSLDYARVHKTSLVSVEDGRVTVVTPSELFEAVIVVPVEEFGAVYLYADNEGEGFVGTEKEIDFCYEAARTRLVKVWRWIREQEKTGFTVSSQVKDRLNRAEKHFREAASISSLRESLWAGEMAVLEKARYDIAKRGWRKDFQFGGFYQEQPDPERSAKYDKLFTELFNCGILIVDVIWTPQRRREEKNWTQMDKAVSLFKKNHIKIVGHTLLCFVYTPEWVRALDYETLKSVFHEDVYEVVQRYKGTIEEFTITNELHDWANDLSFTWDQLVEMSKLSSDTTREANPNAFQVLNNSEPWGTIAVTPESLPPVVRGNNPYVRPLTTPYKYVERCIKAGVNFDSIGLQLYYGYGLCFSCQDMFETNLMLDRFASFGKPIHITEMGCHLKGVESGIGKHLGTPFYWHKPWSEETQAEWVEALYTLCYSKPYITSIKWWQFEEGGRWEMLETLIKKDLTPKEAYSRLKKLIDGWRSL